VSVQGVSKSYADVRALRDVSLEVRPGEFLTLLGPSGCGKTTLLRLLAGFEQPDAGAILISGRDVAGQPPYRRPVNTVFQHYALFPHRTVAGNVAFGLETKGLPKAEIEPLVVKALEMVRLHGLGARRIDQLSGGQKQRVAFARAVVLEPEVLLLDEPLAALDLKLRKEMQVELKNLQERLGITFVFVTHDQDEALLMSDRIAVINQGRIEQLGTPDGLYERPRTRFVADFVGTNNLVAGEVQGDGGRSGDLVVSTALGPLRAVASGAVSGRCVLAVRPENVALGATAGDGNRVDGRVSFVSYLGNTLRYDVQTASGLVLKADIRDPWHHEPLPVGRPVTLSFPPSVTLAVSDDA